MMKNVALLWVLLWTISCTQSSENQDNTVSVIAPKVFQQKLAETPDAILVDVRTPAECAEGVLENSQQINYSDADFEQKITALDKSKPVFVYCKSGGRSGRTASILQKAGFQQVYDLEGGITAWKNEGLNIVKP